MFSELTRRLAARPGLASMAAILSLVIAVLGLAPSLYAAQVMGRFVTHGHPGTLLSVSVGLVLALAGEVALRYARHRLLEGVCLASDEALASTVLDRTREQDRAKAVATLDMVGNAYSAARIAVFMDLLAVALYMAALWVISSAIGIAATVALAASVALELVLSRIASVATAGRDGARGALMTQPPGPGMSTAIAAWIDQSGLAGRSASARESAMVVANGLSYSVVLAVGAVMVVDGLLSAGALFGIGLLTSRAMGMALKATTSLNDLQRARPAMEAVVQFLRETPAPPAPSGGTP